MTAVNVTAEHIAEGIRQDCERCPVALAIAAALPDLRYISVLSRAIIVLPRGRDFINIDTPRAVRKFVRDFDAGYGDPVEPFSFDLEYPAVTS